MTDRKSLILGCASTGAKFTPGNHRATGDVLLDQISAGATIKNSPLSLIAEAEALYGMGCRYYHYHARNPKTHEQSTSNEIYQQISRSLQQRCNEMLISFGASRNGPEVRESIRRFGEWERISQSSIPLHLGGAHFVTAQAAVELQLMCEVERQYGDLSPDFIGSEGFSGIVAEYQPSDRLTETSLETYSTRNGADYGRTSPLIQFEVYRNTIQARQRLGLFHEVEWVQFPRSYALTRYAVEHPQIRLGGSGQLNITLLFGFSPRLPFPKSYAEFKQVVDAARTLEYDLADPGVKKRHVTVSVGAAVLPEQADDHVALLDVGSRREQKACALRRLAAYAAQPGSGVDVFRFGMEDTPYAVDTHDGPGGRLRLAGNLELAEMVLDELAANGARIETDHDVIFERMGLNWVKQNLFFEQRQRPLGQPVELWEERELQSV
ncbi:3-keto-5-aminohexanoate cleavage protein [Streptomyces roseoverticillatus]|uniref:3-keto-5-aminohexanoate cleavage protein n=1 Tax=Streptomyces roseoverticillatus TaxID=66429 RepID=UPI00146FCEE7|nr:3-keto-5-aminohexanoate cleavage protein [Streptomyces roseoverticillatus]